MLLGLTRSLHSRKAPYVTLSEIREGYQVVCEEYEVEPVREIEEYVQDLCDRGIIDMKSLTELGISGVSAEDLETFFEWDNATCKEGTT